MAHFSTRQSRRFGKLVTACAILAVAGLSGCSTASTGAQPSGTAGEPTSLRIVLHSNPSTDAALKTVTAAFEKANPDIKVELSFIPSADYPGTRTARLAAGTADIVEGGSGSASGQPAPSYTKGLSDSDWVKGVAAGQWVDLTDQAFIKNFDPVVVDALAIGGKTYQVPTMISGFGGVFYNKDIFKAQGIAVPTTWDEFVAAMDKLQAAGITPLSAGGKDKWPLGLATLGLMSGQYPTLEELKTLDEQLWTGAEKLNAPKLVRVLEQTKTLYKYMFPNFAGVDYATAQGQFTTGKAAMTFDGTWSIQQFATQAPTLNFGYFPVPGSDDSAKNTGLTGKVDFTMAIPTSSKNKEAATKWLAFYSAPENYAVFAQEGGVLPVQPKTKTSDVVTKTLGPYAGAPFKAAWDQVINLNPKAGPAAASNGLNYAGLAPLGTLGTAQEAQDAAAADWAAGLGG